MLLVFEMVLFMSLIMPLPFTWKRKMFTFISENKFVARLQYGMKVSYHLRHFEKAGHNEARSPSSLSSYFSSTALIASIAFKSSWQQLARKVKAEGEISLLSFLSNE